MSPTIIHAAEYSRSYTPPTPFHRCCHNARHLWQSLAIASWRNKPHRATAHSLRLQKATSCGFLWLRRETWLRGALRGGKKTQNEQETKQGAVQKSRKVEKVKQVSSLGLPPRHGLDFLSPPSHLPFRLPFTGGSGWFQVAPDHRALAPGLPLVWLAFLFAALPPAALQSQVAPDRWLQAHHALPLRTSLAWGSRLPTRHSFRLTYRLPTQWVAPVGSGWLRVVGPSTGATPQPMLSFALTLAAPLPGGSGWLGSCWLGSGQAPLLTHATASTALSLSSIRLPLTVLSPGPSSLIARPLLCFCALLLLKKQNQLVRSPSPFLALQVLPSPSFCKILLARLRSFVELGTRSVC